MSAGLWVFVCGPSGAGKDSVIGWAAQALAASPRFIFSRRLVTRANGAEPGQDDIGEAALRQRHEAGGLAWHWQAHGLLYGVDARYCADVAAGRIVVVNGSREHVAQLAPRADRRVVLVDAPPALLANRLQARGRESPSAVASRLARNAGLAPLQPDHRIVNDSELAAAGRSLQRFLESLRGLSGPGQ